MYTNAGKNLYNLFMKGCFAFSFPKLYKFTLVELN